MRVGKPSSLLPSHLPKVDAPRDSIRAKSAGSLGMADSVQQLCYLSALASVARRSCGRQGSSGAIGAVMWISSTQAAMRNGHQVSSVRARGGGDDLFRSHMPTSCAHTHTQVSPKMQEPLAQFLEFI